MSTTPDTVLPSPRQPIIWTLNDLLEWNYHINVHNGWFDGERTFGDEIALIHSEASEALEAFRADGFSDLVRLAEGMYPPKSLTVALAADQGRIGKPEGVASELADIVIRVLDSAKRHGIDIEDAIVRKLNYNATRGYRHGGKAL